MQINQHPISTLRPLTSASKKTMIVLLDTVIIGKDRLFNAYERVLGAKNKIPAFTIMRNGDLYQHYDFEKYYTMMMTNVECSETDHFDNDIAIYISLENGGAIIENERKMKTNIYNQHAVESEFEIHNWLQKTYEFQKYTDKQIKVLIELCNHLIVNNGITRQCVSTPFSVMQYKNHFAGIAYEANVRMKGIGLNPTFPYAEFKKQIENG